jgi:hypothetical protein
MQDQHMQDQSRPAEHRYIQGHHWPRPVQFLPRTKSLHRWLRCMLEQNIPNNSIGADGPLVKILRGERITTAKEHLPKSRWQPSETFPIPPIYDSKVDISRSKGQRYGCGHTSERPLNRVLWENTRNRGFGKMPVMLSGSEKRRLPPAGFQSVKDFEHRVAISHQDQPDPPLVIE